MPVVYVPVDKLPSLTYNILLAMKIIRNYLLRELVPPFILSLIISTFILTAGNIIQMADLIINKGVNAVQMFRLVGLLMPSVLIFTIPISVLSSVLLGFARLSNDNEIIALRASGISIFRISGPVLMVGLIISLISIPFNYKIMPESSFRARRLVKEIGVRKPTALIEPGIFIKVFKDYVIFIYDMKGNKLKHIRIYQPQENGPTRTLIAQTGEIISIPGEAKVKIKLTNGIADEVSPEDPNVLYKLAFKNYYLTLDLKDALQKQKVEKKAREMTLGELRAKIKKFKEENIDTTPLKIEIHNKISLAFSNLIFVLLAIPIGIKTQRREKSINFGMALTVFLIYWLLMLGGVACVIPKFVPPWLGVWFPNLIFGIVAVILFARILKR